MLEGIVFLVVLAFGAGGGAVFQHEKDKQELKPLRVIECPAQCQQVEQDHGK